MRDNKLSKPTLSRTSLACFSLRCCFLITFSTIFFLFSCVIFIFVSICKWTCCARAWIWDSALLLPTLFPPFFAVALIFSSCFFLFSAALACFLASWFTFPVLLVHFSCLAIFKIVLILSYPNFCKTSCSFLLRFKMLKSIFLRLSLLL